MYAYRIAAFYSSRRRPSIASRRLYSSRSEFRRPVPSKTVAHFRPSIDCIGWCFRWRLRNWRWSCCDRKVADIACQLQRRLLFDVRMFDDLLVIQNDRRRHMTEMHFLECARQSHGKVVGLFVGRVQQLQGNGVLAAAHVVLQLFNAAAGI